MTQDLPTSTIIEPSRGWPSLNLVEFWKYRELLFFFTWRDVKVRYKQTILGTLWALIQPVMMMVVFTVVFGRMAKVPTGGVPYPIFVYSGLLAWTFFQTAITNSANSLVRSERLITKVYFPRMAIPFASVGAATVDFAIQFAVLIALMLYFQIVPTVAIVALVPLTILTVVAALAVGLILAALNVAYRDFRYVVPYLVQLWLFATPTVYMNPDLPADALSANAVVSREDYNTTNEPLKVATTDESATAVPSWLATTMRFNPMTGLIASFRAAILGEPFPVRDLAISTATILGLFAVSLFYFRRVEDSFADIV